MREIQTILKTNKNPPNQASDMWKIKCNVQSVHLDGIILINADRINILTWRNTCRMRYLKE